MNKKELIMLGQFLQTPFHNNRTKPIALYNFISPFFPKFDHTNLTWENAFNFVFPGETYNVKRIRNTYSELSLLVEDFLVWRQANKNTYSKKRLLVEALSERNSYKLFQSYSNKLLKGLDSDKLRDMHYFREKNWILHQQYFHPDNKRLSVKEDKIDQSMQALDDYFLIAKMRYACELLSREKILAKESEISLLDESRLLLLPEHNSENTIAILFADLIGLIEGNHPTDLYQKVKNNFEANMDKMNWGMQTEILRRLINYAIAASHSKDASFMKEQLELYKIGLNNKLLIENGRITDTTFTNIVIIAAVLKEFDWLEEFLVPYSRYLEESIKEEALTLCRAYIYFHKKNFEKARDEVATIDLNEFRYALRARGLGLRIYFELFLEDSNLFDLLDSKIIANERYLRRKALSKTKRQAYLNLGRFLKKMAAVLVLYKPNEQQKNKWLEEINNKKQLIARTWLIEKIHSF